MASDVDEVEAGLLPATAAEAAGRDGCGDGEGEVVPFVVAPAVGGAAVPAARPALDAEVELEVLLAAVVDEVVVLVGVEVVDWLLGLRVEPTNLRNRLFMDGMSLLEHRSQVKTTTATAQGGWAGRQVGRRKADEQRNKESTS